MLIKEINFRKNSRTFSEKKNEAMGLDPVSSLAKKNYWRKWYLSGARSLQTMLETEDIILHSVTVADWENITDPDGSFSPPSSVHMKEYMLRQPVLELETVTVPVSSFNSFSSTHCPSILQFTFSKFPAKSGRLDTKGGSVPSTRKVAGSIGPWSKPYICNPKSWI